MIFRLTSLIFTLTLIGAIQIAAQVTLPTTLQGKTVHEFIDAFNSGDDATMAQFYITHVSKEGLARRSVEERVQGMKRLRGDAKSLSLLKLLNSGESSIEVVAASGSGDALTLTFEFEPTPEHKFAALRIEMGAQESSGGPPMSKKEFVAETERLLTNSTRENKFSGAVLVAHDSTVLLKKAYGDADKRFNVPNRTDTKFNLGSINKFFTRLAIGQLLEAGKLSLDTPVIAYLPDYPNKSVAEKVTIDQLLNMSSGMGDFFGEKFQNTPKDKIRTLNDYLQFFVNDTLLFEPGTQRRYSNAGYIVLGLMIEKISGQDYFSYVREHIFAKAGMKNSNSFASDVVVPNIATGYLHPEANDKSWISNIHMLPGRGSSAGGGYSTLDDLQMFIRALLSGKLLSPKYTEWMLAGRIPLTDPPLPLKQGGIGIAGGTSGVNAAIEFDAGTGNIVIVLANYDPPAAEQISKQIRDMMKRVK